MPSKKTRESMKAEAANAQVLRPMRLMVNWVMLITLPLWAGTFFICLLLYEAGRGKVDREMIMIMRGERFFWQELQ